MNTLEAPIAHPTNDDLAEVRRLSHRIVELQRELHDIETQLAAAWKRVPTDETILRRPYKSDIAVTCTECGMKTKWRLGTGAAKCQPVCVEKIHTVRETKGISSNVWNILMDEEC